ncbi:MAG: hypothetical protein GY758_32975 [Fuerstiella sp.]|jgi:hypothetical protein|nr:hypothetical protein [Fuerstiella sp.]MCP4505264.1 hypothetical protein [Fuerstiella sp.]MDG2131378.1 hypothetical protein [Fuerstiella sp.]
MNYLAHGYRFLESPLFLAGTAVPDWLSVVNRRVRARSHLVRPAIEATDCHNVRDVGQGILQHHHDDDVFHRSQSFQQMEAELSVQFRRRMPDRFDHRPGFLGHIVVELMLDATLAVRDETLLDRYYSAMSLVDAAAVESAVNQMAAQSTDRLAWFIDRFREERFLDDYADDERMFVRINQVLKRVKLPAMDHCNIEVLAWARQLLLDRGQELVDVVTESAPAATARDDAT